MKHCFEALMMPGDSVVRAPACALCAKGVAGGIGQSLLFGAVEFFGAAVCDEMASAGN